MWELKVKRLPSIHVGRGGSSVLTLLSLCFSLSRPWGGGGSHTEFSIFFQVVFLPDSFWHLSVCSSDENGLVPRFPSIPPPYLPHL